MHSREKDMEIKITEQAAGREILSLLRAMGLSSSQIRRLKRTEGGITVDGIPRTVRYRLAAGETLVLALADRPEDENDAVTPEDIPLDILYEDDSMIVLSKPADMPTHPSHRHRSGTLANALAGVFARRGVPFVFRAVNRLDRDTSGVVLVAKDQLSAKLLAEQMQRGEIQKEYIALVSGKMEGSGFIDMPIRRERESIIRRVPAAQGEGDAALTAYEVIGSDGEITAVAVSPQTGRTHQIRVHFFAVGHPLCGDDLYGGTRKEIARQALHAHRLTLRHPMSGERMVFEAPLPQDMQAVLAKHGMLQKGND